jgi:hypothetical protein
VLLDVVFHEVKYYLCLGLRMVVFDDLSVVVHHELGKIPGNLMGFVVFLVVELTVVSEESINGMCVLSIDFDLLHYGEVAIVLAPDEVLNFLRSSRLLLPELVAREGDDF